MAPPGFAWIGLLLAMGVASARADVNDSESERRLSIPSVATGISLPKEDWALQREQRRPGDTAAYYMMASDSRKIQLSVFIDRTAVCQSAESCLDASLKSPAYKDAKELDRSSAGAFTFATFRLSQINGVAVEQANVLASAYVNGAWFDVHISKGAKERPDMSALLDVLRELKIK